MPCILMHTDSRSTGYEPLSHAMFVSFYINGESGLLANCELRIPDSDPHQSWFGRGCDAFTISWGYKDDTDGAVMTVCK